MALYRLNFGNGQVQDCKDYQDAKRQLRDIGDANTYIERRDLDTGEWFYFRR